MGENRILLHRAASPGVWQLCPASLGTSSQTALKAEAEHSPLQEITNILLTGLWKTMQGGLEEWGG